jgi:uncharacterized protein involved in outer membrane biogenesis
LTDKISQREAKKIFEEENMTLKRKKIYFIATSVIILVVFTSFFVLLLNLQTFKPQIEVVASNALGMDVRIKGRLSIDLFPGFGISLHNVSVQNGGVDVVIVEKMRLGLKLIPLMMREVRISRVGLIKPVFSLVRYKNGMSNFEKPERTLSRKPFAVGIISISQGRLVYADERTSERTELDNFDVTVRNLLYSGMDNGAQFKKTSFTGDVSCKTLKINNFTLTDFVMRMAGGNGILDLNPVSMDIFGGTEKGNIHVDVTGASPHYRVSTTLSRFRIEDLIQASSPGDTPKKSMEGTANFYADLTATGTSVVEARRSLNGDFSLNGENIILYSIDIDALIPKYERSQNFNLVDVGAFFLVGPFGPVITKSYNFASLYVESQGGKGIIKKLISAWKVNNGIAEATDVALASNKQRVAMNGRLNFINDRFVDVVVAVLDKRGCAVYSQKVYGPFRKPKIEKISVLTSISGSVLNALGDSWKFIRGKECKPFYSGSVAQPEN